MLILVFPWFFALPWHFQDFKHDIDVIKQKNQFKIMSQDNLLKIQNHHLKTKKYITKKFC